MTSLRTQLLEMAEAAPVGATPPTIGDRPVFALAPMSELGKRYMDLLKAKGMNFVSAVDDLSTAPELYGVPRWSLFDFSKKAASYSDAVAVDFSVGRFAGALFAKAARDVGLPRVDCVTAFAEFDLPAVYETVTETRTKTLQKLDRFLALEDRFADDLSRETLYSALMLRLSYDRAYLSGCLMSGEHEYFSSCETGQTFQLGPEEVFCDAGAFIGLVTCKFLGATNWRYRSIAAFEPDRINFRHLGKLRLLPLHDLNLRSKAISDRAETLSFVESGTVSSYIAPQGSQSCETVRLDDELEALTFLKMDIEGFESRALKGASRLIKECSPRMAITAYHYPYDLLDIVDTIDSLREGYVMRLRHHYNYYYDTILYASPYPGWGPQ
jgi:FkbM family methyltransferase